jgi:hypothetical protein
MGVLLMMMMTASMLVYINMVWNRVVMGTMSMAFAVMMTMSVTVTVTMSVTVTMTVTSMSIFAFFRVDDFINRFFLVSFTSILFLIFVFVFLSSNLFHNVA